MGNFCGSSCWRTSGKYVAKEPQPEMETETETEPGGKLLAAVPYFLFPGATASPHNNNNNRKQRNIRE